MIRPFRAEHMEQRIHPRDGIRHNGSRARRPRDVRERETP